MVFASLFFTDVTSEFNAFDWEIEEAREEENIPDDGAEEHDVQTPPEDSMSVSAGTTSFTRHLVVLHDFASMFLHDYLHSPTFEELWFIGVSVPDDGRIYRDVGNAGIGYRQMMETGAGELNPRPDAEYSDTDSEDMDHTGLTIVDFYGRIISRQRESWWWWDWGRQDLH